MTSCGKTLMTSSMLIPDTAKPLCLWSISPSCSLVRPRMVLGCGTLVGTGMVWLVVVVEVDEEEVDVDVAEEVKEEEEEEEVGGRMY